MALASKLRITGTPGFIIARTDPENPSKVKGIGFLRGARPFESFKQVLDQALGEVKK